MRFLVVIFLILGIYTCIAQIQDNFKDGDFSRNPIWIGKTADYQVIDKTLRLNAIREGKSYLVTLSNYLVNAECEFLVNLKFPPSANNNFRFYLASDQADLSTQNQNGYFLQIGENGNKDAIEFYRQNNGNIQHIARGIDAIATKSSNLIRIRVRNINGSQWQIEADSTGGYNFSTQISTFDNLINSSSYTGFLNTYTQSNSKNFEIDDIYIGPIRNNYPSLVALGVDVQNKKQIKLSFNQQLDFLDANNISNYRISPTNNINSVSYNHQNEEVIISLSDNLQNNINYSISINNIKTARGFTGNPQTLNFTYQNFPTEKSLIVSEIMCNPSPNMPLPMCRYIEIFNTTNQNLNLSEYSLCDELECINLPFTNINPSNYIVLTSSNCSDSFSLSNILFLQDFPTFNINGDKVILKKNNVIIDSVSYSNTWYKNSIKSQGGYSLEKLNLLSDCSPFNNWIACESPLGGTPGSENSVIDTSQSFDSIKIEEIYVNKEGNIIIKFNNMFNSFNYNNSTFEIENYSINYELQTNNSIKISFNKQPLENETIKLLISDIVACDYKSNLDTQINLTYAIPTVPKFGEIVISEIMVNPNNSPALPKSEYIELLNTTIKIIDLENIEIKDPNANTFIKGGVIQPSEVIILCPDSMKVEFSKYGKTIGVLNWISLNNEGDTFGLYYDNSLIHSLVYKSSDVVEPIKKEGYSLEIKDVKAPCNFKYNLQSTNNSKGGTPGELISEDIPKVVVPRVNYIAVLDDDRLIFESNVSLIDVEVLGIDYNDIVPINITQNRWVINLTNPLTENNVSDLTIKSTTCLGDLDYTVTLSKPSVYGSFVFNEILPNPKTEGSKFIELVNNSDFPTTTYNLALADYRSQIMGERKPISYYPIYVPARGYLVLTDDFDKLANTHNLPEDLPRFNTEIPSIPADSGHIVILDSMNQILDRLPYNDKMHSAFIKEDKGVSLEKISPERSSSDAFNWKSASSQVGYATPGLVNSQTVRPSNADKVLWLESEILSPDGDGFEDFLTLNYKTPNPEYRLKVAIYDLKGRLVVNLLDNIVGTEGVITWDGMGDNQLRQTSATYILMAECYDANGDYHKLKKAITLINP